MFNPPALDNEAALLLIPPGRPPLLEGGGRGTSSQRHSPGPSLGCGPAYEAPGCDELDTGLDASLDAAVAELLERPEQPQEPHEPHEPPELAAWGAATARELDACFRAALGPREIDPLQILYSPEAALPRELDLGHEAAEDRALAEFERLSEEQVNRLVGPALRRLCTLNQPCEARLVGLQALEHAPRRFAERAAHLQTVNALASAHATGADLRRVFTAAAARVRLKPGGLRLRTVSESLL